MSVIELMHWQQIPQLRGRLNRKHHRCGGRLLMKVLTDRWTFVSPQGKVCALLGPDVPLSRLASRTKTIAYEQSRVQRTKVENVETEALATRLASSSQSIVASSFTLLEKLFHSSTLLL